MLLTCVKVNRQGDHRKRHQGMVHSDVCHPEPLVACTLMCLGALRVSWPSDHPNTRVSHVRVLGHERGGKEDIIGSQVPVYDWRWSVVKIEQSTGYILQDRALEREGTVRHML